MITPKAGWVSPSVARATSVNIDCFIRFTYERTIVFCSSPKNEQTRLDTHLPPIKEYSNEFQYVGFRERTQSKRMSNVRNQARTHPRKISSLVRVRLPVRVGILSTKKKNAGLLEWAVGLITSGASRPGAVNNSSVYSIPNKLHRGLQHRGHELLHITAQATAVWILVSIFTFQPNCLGESGFTQ